MGEEEKKPTKEELKEEYDRLECEKKIAESKRALENSDIEDEKAKATLEKQIAEAERDTLKAKFPDTEIKVPEGKLTVNENVTIESQIMAYLAAFGIADQISIDISESENPDRVVICEQSDINSLYLYKTFLYQVSILKKQYEEKCEKKPEEVFKFAMLPMAALVGGTSILKSIIGFASLFRTDTEIKGVKVEIDKEALIAEVARALRSVDIVTVYPAFNIGVSSKFLNELSELKRKIENKIKENADNQKIVIWLKDLDDQCSKLLTSLTITDEKTGVNKLEKVLQGEKLDSLLNNEDTGNGVTYMLYLKVAAAGGNNTIRTTISGNKLSHTGGAVIVYFLIDKNGELKGSNTYYNLAGPTEFKIVESEIKMNNFKM